LPVSGARGRRGRLARRAVVPRSAVARRGGALGVAGGHDSLSRTLLATPRSGTLTPRTAQIAVHAAAAVFRAGPDQVAGSAPSSTTNGGSSAASVMPNNPAATDARNRRGWRGPRFCL